MPSVFLVSDTHFGHAGVCRFTRNDGVTKLRPWTDPDEMDEAMVKAMRWTKPWSRPGTIGSSPRTRCITWVTLLSTVKVSAL